MAAAEAPERVLEDWKVWPSTQATATLATARRGDDGWLDVNVQKGNGRAGLAVQPASGTWDLASFAEIAVPVRNPGPQDLRIMLRVDDDKTGGLPAIQHRGGYCEAIVPPGPEPAWLVVPLGDGKPSPLADKFISMKAAPSDFVRRGTVHGDRITKVSVFVPDPRLDVPLIVGPVVARGTPAPLRDWPESRIFPFIDEYGQYMHRDWPTKIHADADFAQRRQAEEPDLAAHPRPAHWSRYGGWAQGPRLAASGFFRTEKRDGVWWMVDPDGYLFWSHGVVRVGARVRVGGIYHGTPLPDRERFMRLPPINSPLGAFFGTEPQSTRGYYVGRDNHAVYDHLEANLFRKYGPDWPAEYASQALRRLPSWGLNTIANSSDPAIYTQRKMPYTAIVYSAPMGKSEFRIEGSGGNWGKLPDPFDPGWRELMERTLRTELKESLNDPWCLGFFVDNELRWGDTCYVAEATLASPAVQPAKKRLAEWLEKKHGSIEKLNAAWGTKHESWASLLASTECPDRKRKAVRADLEAMSELVIDAYFRGCRDAIKAAAPDHLYLGCRFAGGRAAVTGNVMVIRAAARYCDIVSINSYTRTVADLALPKGADRPILIGEFHFDAMHAPMQPAGLVLVADQAGRGQAYRAYVRSALENPAIIGTHWFQFYDQPTSGRFDGENYQTGLLDTADTPYPQVIAACRDMGRDLYQIRLRAAPTTAPTGDNDAPP
jgi:hypothetical protein